MANVCCGFCNRWKNRLSTRLINTDSYAWIREKLNLPDNLDEDFFLCCACELSIRRGHETGMGSTQSSNSNDDQSNIVFDEYYTATNYQIRCCICHILLTSQAIELTNNARIDLLIDHDIYVPPNTRVCNKHVICGRLSPDVFVNRSHLEPLVLNVISGKNLINDLISQLRLAKNRPRLDLEDPQITDDEVKMWTGWRRNELSAMHRTISGAMKDSKNRSTELALAMFWIKLRTNLTYDQIGMLMNYKSPIDSYRKRVAEACLSVQNNLLVYFVPNFLGVGHLNRDQALSHQTIYSRTLFGDNVALILDGTYYFIQKSQDHTFQRSTYSGHKKRHLVKMLSIVLPDGYVVDTIGPFAGSANDASITESILELNDTLQLWTEDGDILLVDRGFRDCIGSLEDAGFEVRMPAFLPAKQRQLSTEDANVSRLITKNRWIVEAYHGRVKKWALLSECIHNSLLPNIAPYVRIITAAMNCFYHPKFPPLDPEQHRILAESMLELSTAKNELAYRVNSGELSARARWINIDASTVEFPRLQESELFSLFFGSYQLKQSRTYVEAHLEQNEDFLLQKHPLHPNIIRSRIHSKHHSREEYYCWIKYNQHNSADDNDPFNVVQAAYCQCKAGAKTVGFCAHTACLVWYLSFARHQDLSIPAYRTYIRALLLPLLQ